MSNERKDVKDAVRDVPTAAAGVELDESALAQVAGGGGEKPAAIKFDGVAGESTKDDHKG